MYMVRTTYYYQAFDTGTHGCTERSRPAAASTMPTVKIRKQAMVGWLSSSSGRLSSSLYKAC